MINDTSKKKGDLVSIITINYNGYNDTIEFIKSLEKYETFPYEVIVVDNASTSLIESKTQKELFLSNYKDNPKITLVFSEKNLGFAGGNNLGYFKSKGNFILFMNNDMLLDSPFLENMVNRLKSSNSKAKIGLVSPQIRYNWDRNRIQYAGFTQLTKITNRNHQIGYKQKLNSIYNKSSRTAYAHGACMMTTRKIIDKVGLNTEKYFLFYEELDWSMQFRNTGYEIWYEPASHVYHKEGATIKTGSPLREYYHMRSRILFVKRNSKGLFKLLSLVYICSISLIKETLTNLFKGNFKTIAANWKGCIKGLIA